jgi:hypothetical protein
MVAVSERRHELSKRERREARREYQQENRVQDELDRELIDREACEPAIAGLFRDRSLQIEPRLRVIAVGRHADTGVRYMLVQNGGSGARWYPESEVELRPDEPAP